MTEPPKIEVEDEAGEKPDVPEITKERKVRTEFDIYDEKFLEMQMQITEMSESIHYKIDENIIKTDDFIFQCN